MAQFAAKLLLLLQLSLTERAEGVSNFNIVKPFPENISAIEGTSVEVTCVAFDSSGETTPERIQFKRINNGVERNITATEIVYFRNKTKEVVQDGKKLKKLFVTMVIRNVTLRDDSNDQLGRYECHAFAVGESVKKHGFTVSVIRTTEIPTLTVPKGRLLRHGENATLTCNLTEGKHGNSTGLKEISWYKDGVEKQTVQNPNPGKQQDPLLPLKLINVGVKDGGKYTCLLVVLLRNNTLEEYNVSVSTVVEISAWLDKQKVDPEFPTYKGRSVSLECPANGFPLHVEWKFKKKGEDTIKSCINGSDGKYRIHRKGIYERYFLTVSDLQYTDRGSYFCCLPSNCSENVQDNCQRFVLRVRDPLGPLWPVIGIIVEAIVLFLIITMADRKEKNKRRAANSDRFAVDKQDELTEFTSRSTNDSYRSQVRLRKSGEIANA